MTSLLAMEPDLERAKQAFANLVSDLYQRQGTGSTAFAMELSESLIASVLQAGSREQTEAELSDVSLQLFPDAALFSCALKVKGKAWPPRPPVNTRIELGVRDVAHSDFGDSGSVLFRVEKPLTFSSGFADILIGLLGKLTKSMPISIDALRSKDALITLDFAALIKVLRPDLAQHARHVKLYGVKVSQGKVRFEVGFVR